MANNYGQQIARPGEDFRVADRLEIIDLVWRFTVAMDLADREMFESCFADSLLWDLSQNPVPLTGGPADEGPTRLSREDFMAHAFKGVEDGPSRSHFSQHCVENPLVTFTGPRAATVFAYLRNATHTREEAGEGAVEDRMLAGIYHIDTEAEMGRWRISALRLSLYTL